MKGGEKKIIMEKGWGRESTENKELGGKLRHEFLPGTKLNFQKNCGYSVTNIATVPINWTTSEINYAVPQPELTCDH